jgi:magnesium transporter
VAEEFVRMHPAEAASALSEAPLEEAVEVLDDLDGEEAASLLGRMPPSDAVRCLSGLRPERAAKLLEQMSHRTAAILVRSTPRLFREAVLKDMSYVRRARLETQLQYPARSVGEAMDTDLPAIPVHWSLRQLRDKLLQSDDWIGLPYVYVIDERGSLVGVAHSPGQADADDTAVRSVMASPVRSLYAFTPIEAVVDHPGWALHDRLPVTTIGDVLVGVLRHRDLRSQSAPRAGSAAGAPITEALMTLSELYWKGLWNTIDSLAAPGSASEAGAEEEEKRRGETTAGHPAGDPS